MLCDSYRIQTCNLLIRSQMLYSVELRSLFESRFLISQKRLQRYTFFSVLKNFFYKKSSPTLIFYWK